MQLEFMNHKFYRQQLPINDLLSIGANEKRLIMQSYALTLRPSLLRSLPPSPLAVDGKSARGDRTHLAVSEGGRLAGDGLHVEQHRAVLLVVQSAGRADLARLWVDRERSVRVARVDVVPHRAT